MWDHIPEDQSHDSAGPAESQPQLHPLDTLDMVPKGTFPCYPALRHLLLNYHLNITSSCRYGRTFPKTGLQSGYLMPCEVRCGKSSWVVKKAVPHFPYIWDYYIIYDYFLYWRSFVWLSTTQKECKPLGGKSRYFEKKGLWSAATLISPMKK